MKRNKRPEPSTKPANNRSNRKSTTEKGKRRGPAMVGIGASAGGVSALKAFFEALPAEPGMVFTVIMHLPPDRESELAEVLQSSCKMPVTEVTESVEIETDHVYVIPPDRCILATGDRLSLATFDETHDRRTPVDAFFRSLAAAHDSVVGIILSGSGTDGTVGMKAIKESGGFLMVQAPSEAQFNAMPLSAIASGLVDMVLSVEEIARRLVMVAEQPVGVPTDPADLSESETECLNSILRDLHSDTGHDFMRYKRGTVLRRILRRMQVNGVTHLEEYNVYLRENVDEARALFKELLIGVTRFFRDPESWASLSAQVIPELFDGKSRNDCVRVWVVGCSTGEEAYSLGILLLEYASRMDDPPAIQIFATDLDEAALAAAREGVYPDAIRSDVSAERLEKYFIHDRDRYRVRPELRDIVLFATHNLLRDSPFSRIDLITCRNLLIYLERELQAQIFDIFFYALVPCGYLFLGSSETTSTSNQFRTVDESRRIHQSVDLGSWRHRLPALPLAITRSADQRREPAGDTGDADNDKAGQYRGKLECYGLPSIVVDEDLGVVNLSDTAGRYLLPPAGPIPREITQLVRPALRTELNSALRKAFRDNESSLSVPIDVAFNGQTGTVRILVRPNGKQGTGEKNALVIFIDVPTCDTSEENGESSENAHTRSLESELRETRQKLQATLEDFEATTDDLKAANDALQSMNEEYRSTNEELETSKEELQSLNEELQTVNYELKSKYEELSQAHDDLYNLFISTDIGTIFLDRELIIRHFTPNLHGLFNIIRSDIGRPLSDLTHSLDDGNLLNDAKDALADLSPVEREIRDKNGTIYLMRIRPYRTVHDRINGVVLTFVDITRLRRTEEELRRSEERYRILVENVREYAIFMLDFNRRITTWNRGSERLFGYPPNEALGSRVTKLIPKEDREADLVGDNLDEATDNDQISSDRNFLRKDGTRFRGTGTAIPLCDEADRVWGYAFVIRDNSERYAAEEKLHRLNKSLEEMVRQRTEQLRSLCASVSIAEQRERSRVSHILHDDLQQLVYAASLKLEGMVDNVKAGNSAAVLHSIRTASDCLESALATARKLTFDLNPPAVKERDFVKSLTWLASYGMQMLELRVELDAPESFSIPDDGLRAILFDTLRELLFNAVKHGESTHATVTLVETEEGVCVEVEDNGRGFDPAEVSKSESTGFGLPNIKERFAVFGGDVRIEAVPGAGTRFVLTLPTTLGSDG